MEKQNYRTQAEEHVYESVACIYNWTFNKEKSWEESYKELAIRQAEQHQKLWEKFLELKTKYEPNAE